MRQKGLPKTGGRLQGSLNHNTKEIKQWVTSILESNQAIFENDLAKIEPKDRLQIMVALLKYSIPTLQSVTVEAQIQAEFAELEKLLQKAPTEAIDLIFDKIQKLKEHEQEQEN